MRVRSLDALVPGEHGRMLYGAAAKVFALPPFEMVMGDAPKESLSEWRSRTWVPEDPYEGPMMFLEIGGRGFHAVTETSRRLVYLHEYTEEWRRGVGCRIDFGADGSEVAAREILANLDPSVDVRVEYVDGTGHWLNSARPVETSR